MSGKIGLQKEGIDFVETFAATAKFQSIKCLIAITAFLAPDFEGKDVHSGFPRS